MNLRRRGKQPFSGFTKAEVHKMEHLLKDAKERSLDTDTNFFKRVAKLFNRSSNRAGKPTLKWTQIKRWFKTKQESHISDEANEIHVPDSTTQGETTGNPNIPKGLKSKYLLNMKDLLEMEFEAKSFDGAWYDVMYFLAHKGSEPNLEDTEVLVRFKGFGPDNDEWINVKNHVRQCSVAVEHYECHILEVKDPVVCLQEREDEAKFYEARIVSIEKKMHDVRGCRCRFLVEYDHDSSQEIVQWKKIYCRPELVAQRRNR